MLGILMDERLLSMCPLQSTNERCGACAPRCQEAALLSRRSHSKMIPQEISTWNVFCSVRKHLLDGSLAQACPCRWAKLATHRHWGPLCVYPVLSCPLWPCNRRMRVIAKETGQSPQAHKCSGTWTCLRRLHIRSRQKTTIQKIGDRLPRDTLPLSLSVHLRKPRSKNVAIVSPETWLSFFIVTTRVFRRAGQWSSNMTSGPCSRMLPTMMVFRCNPPRPGNAQRNQS